MPAIDEAFVDSEAPNPDAIKNGRSLVLKGSFTQLHQSEDGSLLFGECKGSGKTPYQCSSDFMNPAKPVHRCSCPSRQFPCKHSLGLLYAFVQGKNFTIADVPEEISAKREKAEVRAEKKKEQEAKPKTVNKSSLAKKIKSQQSGLDLLETLTHDLVRLGMGSLSAKTARQIEEQAKQLGNSYLPGAQAALHAYTKLFSNDLGKFDTDLSSSKRELVYSEALDQLGRLYSLIKQGRSYLSARLEDPEMAPETGSAIAAWLGHNWQLRELKEAGLVEYKAEMIQLAFNSYDDVARKELVDTGIWMNLGSGRIQLTQNYRPYKALNYIKSEDSFFQVAQVDELCIYPGDVNPRIRWDGMLSRPVEAADYKKIQQHARQDFNTVIKEVKNAIKAPLADKHPVYALQFKQIGQVDDEFVMEDTQNNRLVFTDQGMTEEPASCYLLSLLPAHLLKNQVIVCRFRHDLDTRQLRVKPLGIVTDEQIVRLTL